MSKPSGMKLGLNVTQSKKASTPPFDNEFMMENEEQSLFRSNQQQSVIKNDNSISHSRYLPMTQSEKQIKPKDQDNQLKRIKKLNNGIEKLSVSILEMKQKYKDLDMEQILFKKRNEKKENEIKQFLSEKKAEKIKRIKSKKKRMQRQAKSLQQSINLEQQVKKNKMAQAVKQNLNKIKQTKQKRQIQNKQQAAKSKIVAQMYEKIHEQQKKKPKFHLRKIQQEKKLNEKKIQAEKQYLFKRRQNFKPLNFQEFESHGKKHEQLLQQLQIVKKAQKEEQYLKIMQHNKKLQQVYRGRHYDNALEQVQQRKVKKDQPTEKYKKMKNYQQYVRENFVPKVQQKPKQEQFISKHSSMSHRQVRRYRYLQGVSFGEVIESRPAAKTQAQQRKLGNQYMAYMRSLPKRRYDQVLDQSAELEQVYEKKPNPLSQRTGRKSVEIKISDKPTREQLGMLMKQLKNKDKQINMKQKVIRCSGGAGSPSCKDNQIGDEIVFNIQRKLNLLSKL